MAARKCSIINYTHLSSVKSVLDLTELEARRHPAKGEGGFQIVHVSPQGGRGCQGDGQCGLFQGLEYLSSSNDFQKKSASQLSKTFVKKKFS